MMKIAENYSVIVIPKDRAKVRRFLISREKILACLALVGGFLIFTASVCFGFRHYQQAYFALEDLKNRGERYAKERQEVLSHLDELESVVNKNEQWVAKLETVVGIHPVNVGQAGLSGEQPYAKSSVFEMASLDPKTAAPAGADLFDETTLRAYNLRTIDLTEEAKEVGKRLKEVYQFNPDAEYFWTALPTVAPVRGWVTSDFGFRRSPLSGRRQLHEGIDIASPFGAPVMASGDGVVTLSGRHGGLGKELVVDHGYGLATVYGHNSEVLVKEGDHVRRGQMIARVGSTGRSTGPHLHYEVRMNGVPVDPKQFVLEQL